MEKCVEVQIRNQKVGGSIPPVSTKTSKRKSPDLFRVFFGPQGQYWRGFAGGVSFSGRRMKSIFPRSPPESCTAPPPVNKAKAKLIAKLFAVPVRAVSDHLKSIFARGEFSEERAIRKYLRAVLLVLVRDADRARISAPTNWLTNSTRRRKPESAGRARSRRSRRRSNRRASA